MTTERRLRRLAAGSEIEFEDGLISAIAEAMKARGVDDPVLCGDVYEQRLAADRVSRRAGGAYYTPRHIVELVVERTLGPLLAQCTAEQALGLRVVDPSCGGGAFLLEVLRRIEAHCVARGAAPEGLRHRIAEQCLFGYDIDAQAIAVTRLAITLAVGGACAVVGVQELDTLRSEHEPAFDAVVGNPPWGQKGFRFDKEQAAYLRRRYETGSGVLDPFKLFVERSHGLLRRGGRWGLVLPDIVLLKNQQPVRDLVRTRSAIDWIVDLGRAFEGVNLDAVMIVGQLVDQVAPDHELSIWHGLPVDWRAAPPNTHRRAQAVFGELPGHRFNIHLDDASLALVRRLRAYPKLGEVISFHEGVHSGNMRSKLFVDVEPPDGRGARLIVGRGEVARYRLSWAGRWIDLAPQRQPGDYANLVQPAWHRGRKLVVRRTGDRIVAAYDDAGFYFSNNVFVSEFRREACVDELRAWVALLNSRFMTWYFRAVQPRTGRLFAELKIEHLRVFPVPAAAAWSDAWPPLAALSRQMESLARSRDEQDEATARRIDDAICALYDLSTAERGLVGASAGRP